MERAEHRKRPIENRPQVGNLPTSPRGVRSLMMTLTWTLTTWTLAVASMCVQGRAESVAPAPSEYQVKAAFLYNFVKFVDWPETAIDPREPIVLCVLGKDPFSGELDRAIEGKSINGHRVAARHIADA